MIVIVFICVHGKRHSSFHCVRWTFLRLRFFTAVEMFIKNLYLFARWVTPEAMMVWMMRIMGYPKRYHISNHETHPDTIRTQPTICNHKLQSDPVDLNTLFPCKKKSFNLVIDKLLKIEENWLSNAQTNGVWLYYTSHSSFRTYCLCRNSIWIFI